MKLICTSFGDTDYVLNTCKHKIRVEERDVERTSRLLTFDEIMWRYPTTIFRLAWCDSRGVGQGGICGTVGEIISHPQFASQYFWLTSENKTAVYLEVFEHEL